MRLEYDEVVQLMQAEESIPDVLSALKKCMYLMQSRLGDSVDWLLATTEVSQYVLEGLPLRLGQH